MARGNGPKGANGKTALKTARLAPPSPNGGARLPLGNHPGNTGGKPGRSGRLPNAFKQFCRDLAASKEYQEALKRAATDDQHDNYLGAAQLVAKVASPKPTKKTKHSGSVTVRVVRQQRAFNGRHADN